MIIIYHGRQPYLPLMACVLHLGLLRGAEPFLPGGIRRDWQASPLLVAGTDRNGSTICCLAHGRHGPLYWRALSGVAAISSLSLAWVDLDRHLAGKNLLTRAGILLVDRLPGVFERPFRAVAAKALRSGLLIR